MFVKIGDCVSFDKFLSPIPQSSIHLVSSGFQVDRITAFQSYHSPKRKQVWMALCQPAALWHTDKGKWVVVTLIPWLPRRKSEEEPLRSFSLQQSRINKSFLSFSFLNNFRMHLPRCSIPREKSWYFVDDLDTAS